MVQIFRSWRAAKALEVAQPRHAAVLVHDLADRRRRPGRRGARGRRRPRSGRCAPARRRDAARSGKMCPGVTMSSGCRGCHRTALNRSSRAIVRRRRRWLMPWRRIDRHRERGAERRAVVGSPSSIKPSSRMRSSVSARQISAAAVLRHEVDGCRRDLARPPCTGRPRSRDSRRPSGSPSCRP